jgi:hypothetical protein
MGCVRLIRLFSKVVNVLDKVLTYMDNNKNVGVSGLPLGYPDHSPQTYAYLYTTPFKWFLQGLAIGKLVNFF